MIGLPRISATKACAAVAMLWLSFAASADDNQVPSAWMSSPLVSSTGENFSLADLEGKLVLVNFMFTSCAGICPMQTATLRQVMMTLDETEQDNLVFLSISIDPARDVPEQLAKYKREYKIETEAWIFSTGSEDVIKTLTDAFAAVSEDDVLDHRGRYHLLDRQGRLLLSYNSSATDADRISRDLKSAVAHL